MAKRQRVKSWSSWNWNTIHTSIFKTDFVLTSSFIPPSWHMTSKSFFPLLENHSYCLRDRKTLAKHPPLFVVWPLTLHSVLPQPIKAFSWQRWVYALDKLLLQHPRRALGGTGRTCKRKNRESSAQVLLALSWHCCHAANHLNHFYHNKGIFCWEKKQNKTFSHFFLLILSLHVATTMGKFILSLTNS